MKLKSSFLWTTTNIIIGIHANPLLKLENDERYPFANPDTSQVTDFINKIDPLLLQFEQNKLRSNPFQEENDDQKIRFEGSRPDATIGRRHNLFREAIQGYLTDDDNKNSENKPVFSRRFYKNDEKRAVDSSSESPFNSRQITNRAGKDISSKINSISIAKLDSIVSTNWTPDEKAAFQLLFKMSTSLSQRFDKLDIIRTVVPEFESFSRQELGEILDFISNQEEYNDDMNESVWNDQTNLIKSFHHAKIELPCENYENTWYLKSKNKCIPQLTCNSIYQNVKVNPKIIANGLGKQIRTAKFLTGTNITNNSPSGYPGRSHSEILNLNPELKISENLKDPFTPIEEESIKIAYIETKQNDKNGRLVRGEVSDRVNAGLENLLKFQGNENVLEIYGFCNEQIEQTKNKKGDLETAERTIFISEMCQNGDLASFIGTKTFQKFDMIQRVKLIISFLNTFDFLHNSPTGSRINCDMNGLHRALTQFLVTDNFNVVLNDLDDIPLADKTNRCEWGLSNVIERHSENFKNDTIEDFKDNFLAPEQVMSDEQFFNFYPEELESSLANGQVPIRFDTEKIDIWKIPDMVMSILTKTIPTFSQSLDATKVLFIAEPILRQCKEIDYRRRPTASQIIARFEQALENLEINRIRDFNGELDDRIRRMKNLDGPFIDDQDRTKLIDRIMSYGSSRSEKL